MRYQIEVKYDGGEFTPFEWAGRVFVGSLRRTIEMVETIEALALSRSLQAIRLHNIDTDERMSV